MFNKIRIFFVYVVIYLFGYYKDTDEFDDL